MITENLPKLHLGASKDSLRPQLTGVSITNNLCAVSTDAHGLFSYKIQDDFLEMFEKYKGKILKKEVWEALTEKKAIVLSFDDETIEISSVKGKRIYNDLFIDEKQVNFNAVMPKSLSVLNNVEIGLNTYYFTLFQKIFGEKQVCVSFCGSSAKGFILSPINTVDYGIYQAFVMPIGLNGNTYTPFEI